MEAIGGYFELADCEQADNFPHGTGILLNTGRNALEYILRTIKQVSCIYIPYFTCEVVLEPIKRLRIPYNYYHINQCFEIAEDIKLGDNEYIIVNNYYGIKDSYISSLYNAYGEHMIVDCAQAFFAPVKSEIKAFYSSRKYVGVADGGIAYIGNEQPIDTSFYEEEPTVSHSDHLFIRKEKGAEAGFACYQADEEALDNQPIRRMSSVTKETLLRIDYERIKAKRLSNWAILEDALAGTNKIQLPAASEFECPMVYPYAVINGQELRKRLIENKVFVAKYWPNVILCEGFEFEVGLANNVMALPIDQRCDEEDMERIVSILKQHDK